MVRRITKKMVKYLFNNFDPSKASLSVLTRKETELQEKIDILKCGLSKMTTEELDFKIKDFEDKFDEAMSNYFRLKSEADSIVKSPMMYINNFLGTDKSMVAKQKSEELLKEAEIYNRMASKYMEERDCLHTDRYKFVEYEKLLSKYEIIKGWKEKKELADESKQRIKNIVVKSNKEKRTLAKSLKPSIKKNEFCPYCGIKLNYNIKQDVHLDHIYPVSKGGMSTRKNLVYVCCDCNLKKSNLTLRGFIKKYGLDRNRIEMMLEELGKDF